MNKNTITVTILLLSAGIGLLFSTPSSSNTEHQAAGDYNKFSYNRRSLKKYTPTKKSNAYDYSSGINGSKYRQYKKTPSIYTPKPKYSNTTPSLSNPSNNGNTAGSSVGKDIKRSHIQGNVEWKNGNGINHATVTLMDDKGTILKTTKSTGNGFFNINIQKTGIYQITVDYSTAQKYELGADGGYGRYVADTRARNGDPETAKAGFFENSSKSGGKAYTAGSTRIKNIVFTAKGKHKGHKFILD